MANLNPTQLLDWLERNQFLTPAQTEQLRPLLINIPDTMHLVRELIRRDWLTPFQVNQIMKGDEDDLVLGPYRLRERIGEGAMGAVFKAWNLKLGRFVAVKTLNKAMIDSSKAQDRFSREIQAAAQLNHPNIALVRDAEEIDGRLYLIMDCIDGANLAQHVKKDGALPVGEAVEYVRQAALGLQHAFERGIVHRDIKPSNLVVTKSSHQGDLRPLVKILDFGLARFNSELDEGTRLTQIGHMVGTVDFVAPEQAQDARSADIRADIYALGCTLFYLLVGKPPFDGESLLEKLTARVTNEPPWVRTRRPEVTPGLEEVLRKMMARAPQDRYQTPMEAAQALVPFTRMQPAAAPSSTSVAVAAKTGVALAVPVSGPTAGPVMMAQPILTTPTAQEAAAPTVAALPALKPAPAREAAFAGMTASGRDMSTPSAAATPRASRPAKPFPLMLVLALAGGAFACLLGCAGILFLFLGEKPAPKTGSVRIIDAKWSVGDKGAKPGNRHRLLVKIKRTDFAAPVSVYLKGLPAGVTSENGTIPAGSDAIDLPFAVSLGTEPLRKEVTLVVENEEYNARDERTMTLVVLKQ